MIVLSTDDEIMPATTRLDLYLTGSEQLTSKLGTIQINQIAYSSPETILAGMLDLELGSEQNVQPSYLNVTIDFYPEIWTALPDTRLNLLQHLRCLEGTEANETKLTYDKSWFNWFVGQKLPIKITSSHPADVNRLLRFLVTDPRQIQSPEVQDEPIYPYTIYDLETQHTVVIGDREGFLSNYYDILSEFESTKPSLRNLEVVLSPVEKLMQVALSLMPTKIGAVPQSDLDRWLPNDPQIDASFMIGLLKVLLVTPTRPTQLPAPTDCSLHAQALHPQWLAQIERLGGTEVLSRQASTASLESFESARGDEGLVLRVKPSPDHPY